MRFASKTELSLTAICAVEVAAQSLPFDEAVMYLSNVTGHTLHGAYTWACVLANKYPNSRLGESRVLRHREYHGGEYQGSF
jgi:hypothetical protein